MSEEALGAVEQQSEEPQNQMGPPIADKSDAELRQLAMDMVEGKIFGDWQLEDDSLIRMVFLPLAFCGPSNLPQNIGAIYEYMSEAGPRAINGYPSFLSMKVLTQNDRKAITELVKEYVAMRNAFRGVPAESESNSESTTA